MTLLRSLRLRVLLATMLILLQALGLALWLISVSVAERLEEYFDKSLTGYLNQVATVVGDVSAAEKLDRQLMSGDFARPYSGLYWQIENEAGELKRSRSLWDARIELPTDTIGFDEIHLHQSIGPAQQQIRVLERRVIAADGSRWSIAVAGDRASLDAEIAGFRQMLLQLAGVLGLLALLAGLIQLIVVQRPVAALGRAIQDLNTGRRTRLVGRFPSELDALIQSLNQLIDNNEQIAANARMQATNLAHTIKTPVAVIRNELGLLRQRPGEPANWPAIDNSLEKIDRMSLLYLSRARSARPRTGRIRPVHVRPIVFDIVQAIRRLPQSSALTIDYRCPDDAVFFGDVADLEEILGNLIDNASKWAENKVTIHCPPNRRILELIVEDDGPGIPIGEREAMLKPGNRLDDTVPGTGFGLTIVADLIDSCQGSLEFDEVRPHGLRVVVRLPGGLHDATTV